MKTIIIQIVLLLAFTNSIYADDTLKIENPGKLCIKTNMAILLFHGISFQVEYVAGRRIGLWGETTVHREAQSMLNSSLRELSILTGVNYYKAYKKPFMEKMHNGTYAGPYLKYKQGSYENNKCIDYSALFIGAQAGIQSVSKNNIVFNMGMGFGLGYFIKKNEVMYSTFYNRYHILPLDFRANISLGYLF